MKCQEWCFGRKMSLVKSKYEPPLSDYQSLTSDFQLALEFWVPRVFFSTCGPHLQYDVWYKIQSEQVKELDGLEISISRMKVSF